MQLEKPCAGAPARFDHRPPRRGLLYATTTLVAQDRSGGKLLTFDLVRRRADNAEGWEAPTLAVQQWTRNSKGIWMAQPTHVRRTELDALREAIAAFEALAAAQPDRPGTEPGPAEDDDAT